ncbi:RHS repeat-associated core domain-containing protein [Mucilaginibacter sp. UC70_90]
MTDNNKSLYNGGSEWQNDYGNLPDLQQTFYRNYDAALGRWTAVDPVAESAEGVTVYQYAGNNPIMMNDPLGDLLPDPGSKDAPIPWHTDGTWRGKGGPDPVGQWSANLQAAAAIASEIENNGGSIEGVGDVFTYVYRQIQQANDYYNYATLSGYGNASNTIKIKYQTSRYYFDLNRWVRIMEVWLLKQPGM